MSFFFFKQKTAYEMRISDWSSDVCSSDLRKRDGSTLTYQYDALNRMTKKVVPARTGLASTHTRDVYYGYDARGQQLYARFDGASSSSEGLTTVSDALGRMTSSALKMDGVKIGRAHVGTPVPNAHIACRL